ncbi:MAG: hypothetical protein WDZ62_00215 [Candidatus Pacearchaeota archaeon]
MESDGLIRIGSSVFPSRKAAEEVGYNTGLIGALEHKVKENSEKTEDISNILYKVPDKKIEEAYALVNSHFMNKWGIHDSKEVKRSLSRLRELGISVKPYSKLNAKEVKNYFSEIKQNIEIEYNLREIVDFDDF